jgi:hypothetical protein
MRRSGYRVEAMSLEKLKTRAILNVSSGLP